MSDVTRFPRGAECQCGNCGRFFTSPSGFDFHQWWRGRGDKAVLVCLDPILIGMVLRPHAGGGTWALAGKDAPKGEAASLRNALIESLSQQEGPKSAPDAPSQP
jgi:hypothetical protein